MAAVDNDQEIREGFLCPLCMLDLQSVNQLQHHFFNSNSNEDSDSLQTFINFLGKAKKILSIDSPPSGSEETSSNNASTQSSYSTYKSTYGHSNWQNSEIGVTNSHTDYFKRIRESRMGRYVVETNKLIIRLDKLVTNAPSEPVKRKAHEQSVVHWVSDGDVKLCPTCGKSFSIARRRHHCRLCGGIMCDNCSEFISFANAKKLTQPVGYQETGLTVDSPGQLGLSRSSSNSSLNSMINSSGEPHIRTCVECKKLMERRKSVLDHNAMKPVLIQLYERLKKCIEEADSLCPTYVKMAYSLNGGESKYSLEDAQTLRIKLLKLTENVDLLSKRISMLDDPTTTKLQHLIRISAGNFLKEKMLGLPSLPTEDELGELQERYRQNQGPSINNVRQGEDKWASRFVSPESGWGPENETVSSADQTDEDPMLQQMKIIRNYIQQAREAHRYDEVSMLEANLRELQQEYWKGRK